MVKTLTAKTVLSLLAIAWINTTIVTPADTVRIGSHVTDSKPTGTAVIGSGEIFIDADHIIIEDGTVISDKANLIINNKSAEK